jgi:acetylornithine/succinyldiaminopimelate/putrescine aminotransferase
MFSFEHYGIVPDVLVLAKAFGGGMPLGAFISSGPIMHSLANKPELGHITTFGGHPVSCAAALANLQVILREKPYLDANKKAQLFIRELKGQPRIKMIRYKGLMMAVELESAELCRQMNRLLMEKGAVVDAFLFHPQSFRIAPPLNITENEILEVCNIIQDCLIKL